VFVKVHTHGCVEANAKVLLGEAMREMHGYLKRRYNGGNPWALHYVTARETANIIHAAEAGLAGPPESYRDVGIGPPPVSRA
jgi:hypothetical protein